MLEYSCRTQAEAGFWLSDQVEGRFLYVGERESGLTTLPVRSLRIRRDEPVFFLFPRLWLIACVAMKYPVVYMLPAGCSERRVVQIHQAESILHICLELMQSFQLIRAGRHAIAAWSLQKHLVSAIQ